jgi:hypothetical protein
MLNSVFSGCRNKIQGNDKLIKKVLIANRSEIACRIIRSCKAMGIETVAIYSDADANALHVKSADFAVHIGESEAKKSYLDMDKVIRAALESGCDAIHPGYGFLSENHEFNRKVRQNGLIFIGPSAESMELMGSKTSSRTLMIEHGIPVVPGTFIDDIDENKIAEIYPKVTADRTKNRIFIMPTGDAIGRDHFIANYELGLFYAGFGLFDIFSFTVGRSFLPTVQSHDQISIINAKATLIRMYWENAPGGMSLAVGGNITFVNNRNNLNHLYTSINFTGERTDINGIIFLKTGNNDFYTARFGREVIDFIYEDGSFGIGVGIKTKFSRRHGLYFIGELWNINVSKVTNTAIMAGVRLQNTSFSADFGLAVFSVPYIFPVASFAWTPF